MEMCNCDWGRDWSKYNILIDLRLLLELHGLLPLRIFALYVGRFLPYMRGPHVKTWAPYTSWLKKQRTLSTLAVAKIPLIWAVEDLDRQMLLPQMCCHEEYHHYVASCMRFRLGGLVKARQRQAVLLHGPLISLGSNIPSPKAYPPIFKFASVFHDWCLWTCFSGPFLNACPNFVPIKGCLGGLWWNTAKCLSR